MMRLNEKLKIWNGHSEIARRELQKVIHQHSFMENKRNLLSNEEIETLKKATEILFKLENELVFEIV